MRSSIHHGVIVTLVIGLLIGGFPGSVAVAEVRIGGGAGVIGDAAAPMARISFDILSLWFITAAIDTEVWLPPTDGPWLMPFLTISTPLLFKATVGVAPLIDLTEGDVSFPPDVAAVKAGVGAPVGPLELFGEAIFFVTPGGGIPSSVAELGRPIFAFGVTLGF